MSSLDIHMFPCLADNYGYLLHDDAAGVTAAVDTPDAEAILRELDVKGWQLTHILNTHHHHDHAGGNLALKRATGCTIVGPRADAERIPGIDRGVGDGDVVKLGSHRAEVFDTPGHTRGHIVYFFRDDGAAFVGDTLFAIGCGRLFEGSPAQMWSSFAKILRWPDATRIYCAHEYTQSNARFALTVEPDNRALAERAEEIARLRALGKPTIPTTLAAEKATNPFLRAGSAELRRRVGLPDATDVEVFAKTRAMKDAF
ncbi:MAG TPA: hydroxyacylglutathione hydrolase [Gammaproteobacteria bacterium]|nr:hydroxyacylglutathione hydrolase [Gammaproteobacteria bacterium]